MARSQDVKTPMARLAWAKGLFEPVENESGKKNWTCSLLWPKETDLTVLENAALAAAQEEWGDKAVEWVKSGMVKNPFLDGDGKEGRSKKTGEPHAGFPGTVFIRCVSGEDYRPKLFNQKVLPCFDKDVFYSGAWVFAVVNAFTWDNPKNGKGISFGISLVQKVKDGEKFGGEGGPNPSKFLDTIEDQGDAPKAAKTGQGAAGLFG